MGSRYINSGLLDGSGIVFGEGGRGPVYCTRVGL